MDWLTLGFALLLLAICTLPLAFLCDVVNLCLASGLVAICVALGFLPWDPLTMCLGLGPIAVYLLLLGAINLLRRPLLVSGTRDYAAMALAAAGLVLVGPADLFYPVVASIRLGGYVWPMLVVLYALIAVLVLLVVRPRLVIYNISADELRPILAGLVAELDGEARWAGDGLALPGLGVQLHLASLPAMRNMSLVSSGPTQNPQGWRRLELALTAALGPVEVPRNRRAPILLAAAAIVLLFLGLAVWRDPQALAQSLSEFFSV
jgi:hypothetical protein